MKGSTQEAFLWYNNKEVMKECNKDDNNHEQITVKVIRLNSFNYSIHF